jgi:hypothetical protein
MEIKQDKRGWWWHINIFNYLTRENRAHNSKEPFATYEEALQDLILFIMTLKPSIKN